MDDGDYSKDDDSAAGGHDGVSDGGPLHSDSWRRLQLLLPLYWLQMMVGDVGVGDDAVVDYGDGDDDTAGAQRLDAGETGIVGAVGVASEGCYDFVAVSDLYGLLNRLDSRNKFAD